MIFISLTRRRYPIVGLAQGLECNRTHHIRHSPNIDYQVWTANKLIHHPDINTLCTDISVSTFKGENEKGSKGRKKKGRGREEGDEGEEGSTQHVFLKHY